MTTPENTPSEQPSDIPPRPTIGIYRNGELQDALTIERRDREQEARLELGSLRQGDLVAITHEDPDSTDHHGYALSVTSAEWSHLQAFSSTPARRIKGQLEGQDIPEEVSAGTVRLNGSSLGGSSIAPGAIVTGRQPSFTVFESRAFPFDYNAPAVADIEVFRHDSDGIPQIMNPNQLERETSYDAQPHQQRMAQAKELMELFGFKNDLQNSSIDVRTLGETGNTSRRFVATYTSRGAMGNSLTFVDKQTGVLTAVEYYNFNNDDMLKISQVELGSPGYEDHIGPDGALAFDSRSVPEDQDKITYASSARYKLNATAVALSDERTQRIFGIPPLEVGQPYPELIFHADGTFDVQEGFRMAQTQQSDPEVFERTRSRIRYGQDAHKQPLVMAGNYVVPTKDPTELLGDSIAALKAERQSLGGNAVRRSQPDA